MVYYIFHRKNFTAKNLAKLIIKEIIRFYKKN